MDDSEISKPDLIWFKKNLEFELQAIFTVYTSVAQWLIDARMPPPADVHLLVTVSEWLQEKVAIHTPCVISV